MSKIELVPKQPPAVDPNGERYWDPRDLESEMRRSFEICHNCRMCVGYCGTFPDVFGRIDEDIETQGATGAELLDAAAFESATELCWQCKLCYIKCPYTKDEGHEWQMDVPRLLTREKAQRAKRNGVTLQDQVLGEPQLLGKMTAGPMARVANFVNANRLVRKGMSAIAGISEHFPIPPFGETSFAAWLKHHEPLPEAGTRGTVALFATCLADYNFPRIAACAVRVLEKNGWSVVRPEQTCCGMPNLDGGDIDAARAKVRSNVASLVGEVQQGRRIVSLQPTCGYMVRKEWPELAPGDDTREGAAGTRAGRVGLGPPPRPSTSWSCSSSNGRTRRSRAPSRKASEKSPTMRHVTSVPRRSAIPRLASSASSRRPRSRWWSSARPSTGRGA